VLGEPSIALKEGTRENCVQSAVSLLADRDSGVVAGIESATLCLLGVLLISRFHKWRFRRLAMRLSRLRDVESFTETLSDHCAMGLYRGGIGFPPSNGVTHVGRRLGNFA
jgi:hypothetical protein